jgi:hypothetical protein
MLWIQMRCALGDWSRVCRREAIKIVLRMLTAAPVPLHALPNAAEWRDEDRICDRLVRREASDWRLNPEAARWRARAENLRRVSSKVQWDLRLRTAL